MKKVPLFYRTIPSYNAYNSAIYGIIQEFDWRNIGVIHQEVSHYTLAAENLAKFFKDRNKDGGNLVANIVLTLGQSSFVGRQSAVVSNTRIFVAMIPENQAAEVMCVAFNLGLTGANYQWILLGDYSNNWWRNENKVHKLQCSIEDMVQAIESVLILTYHQRLFSPEMKVTFSDKHLAFWNDFESMVEAKSNNSFQSQLSTRVVATYDAVWSIAHALKKVLECNSCRKGENEDALNVTKNRNSIIPDLTRGRPISQATAIFNAAMERTDFVGVAGRITFNKSSHTQQEPITYILQMQSGMMVPIGVHVSSNDSTNLTFYGNKLIWQGTSPPRDRPIRNLQRVSLYVVCVMLGISILGLLFSIIILIVNCIYRRHKVIKASSPYLNIVIVFGCIFGFLSISFLSVENLDINFNIPPSAYSFLCNFRPWLLSLAFTLSFGALFAKTFRIHLIFKDPWKRKRPVKDYKLFAMVGMLLVYDILVLTLWSIINPLSLIHVVVNFNRAEFTEEAYCYCVSMSRNGGISTSFLIWIGLITVPKALLLAFGVFLVVHTSKIKAIFFRDAKFTGIAIFGFVIACGIGVPTAFFTMFFYQKNITYVASTVTTLTCSYLILAMVFIPKFILLHKYRKRIPTSVLLGLNPSFRVHMNETRMTTITKAPGKRSTQKKKNSITQYSGPCHASPRYRSSLSQQHTSSSNARHNQHLDNGIPICLEKEMVTSKPKEEQEHLSTLEGWWEPAFEVESGHLDVEVQEASVTLEGYEGIIYILNHKNSAKSIDACNQYSNGSSSSCETKEERTRKTSEMTSSTIGSYLSTITELEDIDSGNNPSHVPNYFHSGSFHGENVSSSQEIHVQVERSKSFSYCRTSVKEI